MSLVSLVLKSTVVVTPSGLPSRTASTVTSCVPLPSSTSVGARTNWIPVGKRIDFPDLQLDSRHWQIIVRVITTLDAVG